MQYMDFGGGEVVDSLRVGLPLVVIRTLFHAIIFFTADNGQH